ncbi:MAG TPA: hypothetical protein VJ123_03740 [Anaerolineales bacterium]|nr:hypothetical protein [Anaerolineales bacterium]
MSQPTTVFLGYESSGSLPKAVVETLLFSTSYRGHIVESMYLTVTAPGVAHAFDNWTYLDDDVARTAGVFVGREGTQVQHHFYFNKKQKEFKVEPGRATIRVFARIVNRKKPILLFQFGLHISQDLAGKLNSKTASVYFNWSAASQEYSEEQRLGPNLEGPLAA